MKYTILMSCGHQVTVDLVGKNSERERKIKYFETQGLCKECYKKEMQELKASKPFVLNASVLPHISEKNGSILLSLWFEGNTRPYKDKIKLLGGHRWREKTSATDFYSVERRPLCWNKIIEEDQLKDEIAKAISIGAESVIPEQNLFSFAHYQIALEAKKAWIETHKQSSESSDVPDFLKGHEWNHKLYGKTGSYAIYPDGEKMTLTDEQAAEVKKYLEKE